MASRFQPRRPRAPRRPSTPRKPLVGQPPPAAVVDAVLRYHDEVQGQGTGRTLLRVSPKRLGEMDVQAALGDLAARAGRVAILWNEREGEIIRVLEAA
jgi:hypothetical protein